MNIFLILGLLLVFFCTYLSNTIKQKAFALLPDSEQLKVLAVKPSNRFVVIIFLLFIIISICITIFPLPIFVSPFSVFTILMFVYIIINFFIRYQIQKKSNIHSTYLYASVKANVVVVIGLLLFVAIYASSNFSW